MTKLLLRFSKGKAYFHPSIEDPHQYIIVNPLFPVSSIRIALSHNCMLSESVQNVIITHMAQTIQQIQQKTKTRYQLFRELEKLLLLPTPSAGFEMLRSLTWLQHALPDLDRLHGCDQSHRWHSEGDVWVHTMMTLDAARKATSDPVILWAALFHDIGKPDTAKINKRGDISNLKHAIVGDRITTQILKQLCMPKQQRMDICHLVKRHMDIKQADVMRHHKLLKMARHHLFKKLITLSMADSVSTLPRDPCDCEGKLSWLEAIHAAFGPHVQVPTLEEEEEMYRRRTHQHQHRSEDATPLVVKLPQKEETSLSFHY
eukprot:gnl/Dysnectes_brevis/3967_a5172_795.p1 GENE.gnl/Dysnectes_brevis/3967_a5172_795~~gnl/Dysnectes_brevis/3967_a5172_795.p1  ORF type:complete len:316 (+),score=11.68 gnl/Dysnectes_brevis/3967_a5172_795:117-1064(+)